MFARSYETISHIMCPTCGEDIDSGEFLKNNKCFCSDECMRRENLSSFSEHSPITVMQNFVRLFVSQSLIYLFRTH